MSKRKYISNEESSFSITYEFFDETHETQLSMLLDGDNILSFERDGRILTTRWNLDELALWLRTFLDLMKEDPYPVEAKGSYAADKDVTAREFDTDDDAEFDAYYDKLDEWNLRHRWHTASGGAILADIYFQLVDDHVEISWNNLDPEEGVKFKYEFGSACVSREQFVQEVEAFLRAYADHWF